MEFVDRVVALHLELVDGDIPHAFGGALSLAYHALPRGTVEIDLNVFLPPDRADSVMDHLQSLGVERPPNPDSVMPAAGIRCPWGDTHVDLFFSYDVDFFASVHSRVEFHAFEDSDRRLHDLPFLSAEDLCVFKLLFDRRKDWADMEAMLEEAALDVSYVQKWVLHLRGESAWPMIRRLLDLCAEVGR